MDGTDLVTGATGYSGSYVAQRLIHNGRHVRTLTREPSDVPDPIEAFSYRFDLPDEMLGAFRGVDTFYNTYWVRFGRGSFTTTTRFATALLSSLLQHAPGCAASCT